MAATVSAPPPPPPEWTPAAPRKIVSLVDFPPDWRPLEAPVLLLKQVPQHATPQSLAQLAFAHCLPVKFELAQTHAKDGDCDTAGTPDTPGCVGKVFFQTLDKAELALATLGGTSGPVQVAPPPGGVGRPIAGSDPADWVTACTRIVHPLPPSLRVTRQLWSLVRQAGPIRRLDIRRINARIAAPPPTLSPVTEEQDAAQSGTQRPDNREKQAAALVQFHAPAAADRLAAKVASWNESYRDTHNDLITPMTVYPYDKWTEMQSAHRRGSISSAPGTGTGLLPHLVIKAPHGGGTSGAPQIPLLAATPILGPLMTPRIGPVTPLLSGHRASPISASSTPLLTAHPSATASPPLTPLTPAVPKSFFRSSVYSSLEKHFNPTLSTVADADDTADIPAITIEPAVRDEKQPSLLTASKTVHKEDDLHATHSDRSNTRSLAAQSPSKRPENIPLPLTPQPTHKSPSLYPAPVFVPRSPTTEATVISKPLARISANDVEQNAPHAHSRSPLMASQASAPAASVKSKVLGPPEPDAAPTLFSPVSAPTTATQPSEGLQKTSQAVQDKAMLRPHVDVTAQPAVCATDTPLSHKPRKLPDEPVPESNNSIMGELAEAHLNHLPANVREQVVSALLERGVRSLLRPMGPGPGASPTELFQAAAQAEEGSAAAAKTGASSGMTLDAGGPHMLEAHRGAEGAAAILGLDARVAAISEGIAASLSSGALLYALNHPHALAQAVRTAQHKARANHQSQPGRSPPFKVRFDAAPCTEPDRPVPRKKMSPVPVPHSSNGQTLGSSLVLDAGPGTMLAELLQTPPGSMSFARDKHSAPATKGVSASERKVLLNKVKAAYPSGSTAQCSAAVAALITLPKHERRLVLLSRQRMHQTLAKIEVERPWTFISDTTQEQTIGEAADSAQAECEHASDRRPVKAPPPPPPPTPANPGYVLREGSPSSNTAPTGPTDSMPNLSTGKRAFQRVNSPMRGNGPARGVAALARLSALEVDGLVCAYAVDVAHRGVLPVGMSQGRAPQADEERTETDDWLMALEKRSVPDQKQAVGERIFPLVKSALAAAGYRRPGARRVSTSHLSFRSLT